MAKFHAFIIKVKKSAIFLVSKKNFKFNAPTHWQPVQLYTNWGDMTKLTGAVNKPSICVHYALQFHYLTIENAVKRPITVVQSTGDEGMNQLFSMLP